MSKKLILTLSGLAVLLTLFVVVFKPKINVQPRCHVGVMLLKPHYRSWTIYYCHGFQIIDGKERHLYHRPILRFVDMGPILKAMEAEGR